MSISTTRVAGGLRQYLTPQFYVDGRLGGDFASTSDDQENNSMYSEVSLVDDIDESTNFRITYLKQDASTTYTQEIFKSQRVSAALTKSLLRRLGLTLSGFYGKGDYTASNIKDNLFGGDLRLVYDLSPHIKANLGYTYSKTDSNVNTRDYNKNVISMGLSGEF
jgi:uncharacterized protein (PEP-CTERM system associated)